MSAIVYQTILMMIFVFSSVLQAGQPGSAVNDSHYACAVGVEAKGLLGGLAENYPGGLAVVDESREFIFANNRFGAMFGGHPADFIGMTPGSVIPQIGFYFAIKADEALAGSVPEQVLRFVFPDTKEVHHYRISAIALSTAQGRHGLFFVTDVTASVRNREAEQADLANKFTPTIGFAALVEKRLQKLGVNDRELDDMVGMLRSANDVLRLHFGIAEAATEALGELSETQVEKKKVLIAEDEASIRSMMARALTRAGFEVHEAIDGAQAIEVFRKFEGQWTIVITDLTMPRLHGNGFAKAIREAGYSGPLLVISGDATEKAVEAFTGIAVDKFLSKPYSLSELIDAVTAAVAD